MRVIIIVLVLLLCLAWGFCAYCCVVVGSMADQRYKRQFEAYMREKQKRGDDNGNTG